MSRSTPADVLSYIQEAYHRYYDSAFWMRDPVLMAERRKLLEEPGLTSQEILLEAVIPYPSIVPVEQACTSAGLPPGVSEHLGQVVFGADFKLREHQADALRVSLAPSNAEKRNVVVTSGTGSGKTECFMLPVLGRLLRDRLNGIGTGHVEHWWEKDWGE